MRALGSAPFRWLLASGLATFVGTGMQLTATAWLALDDGGAFTVGLVLAARMLPNLLFGLMAGTLADRGDRNRLLVAVRLVALPNTLVHVGGILPGMRAGRLGCSILLVEVMSRRVTATPGRCAE